MATTGSRGSATSRRWRPKLRTFSRAERAPTRGAIVVSRPCSSQTLLDRRNISPLSGTPRGVSDCANTIASRNERSCATAAGRSTLPETGCSRPSTVLPQLSDAPRGSSRPSARSDSRSEQASTPARSRQTAPASTALPSTSGRRRRVEQGFAHAPLPHASAAWIPARKVVTSASVFDVVKRMRKPRPSWKGKTAPP